MKLLVEFASDEHMQNFLRVYQGKRRNWTPEDDWLHKVSSIRPYRTRQTLPPLVLLSEEALDEVAGLAKHVKGNSNRRELISLIAKHAKEHENKKDETQNPNGLRYATETPYPGAAQADAEYDAEFDSKPTFTGPSYRRKGSLYRDYAKNQKVFTVELQGVQKRRTGVQPKPAGGKVQARKQGVSR